MSSALLGGSSSPCKCHARPLGLCLLTAVEARASKPLSSEPGYTPSLPRPLSRLR